MGQGACIGGREVRGPRTELGSFRGRGREQQSRGYKVTRLPDDTLEGLPGQTLGLGLRTRSSSSLESSLKKQVLVT